MKLKFTGHKLENPTVNYISLVDRGANRIPFRIVKQDKGEAMIDLGKIFKRAEPPKEEQTPTVVGLCVQKGVQDEAVRNAIQESGFKVDLIIERDDGTLIYAQEPDVKPEDCTVVKMQQGLILLMKGFDPYAAMGEEMAFSDIVKAQGFIPSISVAFEALQNTMAGILYNAPSGGGDTVIGKVDQALGDFHKYVLDQAKNIPVAAFKAEHAIAEVLKANEYSEYLQDEDNGEPISTKKKKKKPMGTLIDEIDEEASASKEDKDGKEAEATEDGKEPPQKDKEGQAGTLTIEGVKDIAAEVVDKAVASVKDTLAENLKLTKGLAAAINDYSVKLKELAVNQNAFADKINQVEGVAKQAEKTMKGTVVGGPPPGDRQVEKSDQEVYSDDDPRAGNFDTAFLPPQWRRENIRKAQEQGRKQRAGSR